MVVSPMGSGFNAMFTIVPVIVVIGFGLVFGIVIFRMITSTVEWGKNNNSPVLTTDATIVTKRMAVSRRNHINHNNHAMNHHSEVTTYFVTFEVTSGDRIELKVKDKEYGLLAEGDVGKLTFQGTRYKDFERTKI